MAHVNDQYRKAVRKQQRSGNHWPITKYIGTRPWILLYDKSLQESSIEMKVLVSGDLPDGVGGSSIKRRETYDFLDSSTSEMKHKRKYRSHMNNNNGSNSHLSSVARAIEDFGEVRTFVFLVAFSKST
jgi:hypothetical protein